MNSSLLCFSNDLEFTFSLSRYTERFDIAIAETSRQARRQLRRLSPDIVLLDLDADCRHATPFDLYRIMHAQNPHAACVLLVSNLEQEEMARELVGVGARAFLWKPVCSSRLENELDRLSRAVRCSHNMFALSPAFSWV